MLVAFFYLLFANAPAEAQVAKRLVLTDGSYQLASKWEVIGDRVRYFSAERNEWEEVPTSMVDWPATESFEKERESRRNLELRHSEDEERSDAKMPAIAPGLHLPDSGGAYLLDTYNGEIQLTELGQSGGEVNRRAAHNILRGALPTMGSSQSIELKGEHARIQSHLAKPSIFLNLDNDSSAARPLPPAERFRIARLEPKQDARVVGNLKVALTGKINERGFYLPATVEQLPGGWVRLTPSEPLANGEYAVVELLDSRTINLLVWDFGVNPSSPENPGVWKAAPVSSAPAGGASPSDLQGRPR